MSALASSIKHMLIDSAIHSLSDEFFVRYGRHAILGELPDFVDTFGANYGSILEILDERNELPVSISKQVESYPTFQVDLARNLEKERIPRSRRPARDVT